MNLSKYISELLIKNNCVIVPNFGGFIANYQSAVIDDVRNKIYPPSKNVLFNPNLLSNDGLLADYVARQIEKTYGEALESINVEVTEWKKQLKIGRRINVGEVGFLYQKEGKVQFEQNREFNLLLDAYGLSSVQFVSSKPVTKIGNKDNVKTEGKIIAFSPSETTVNQNKTHSIEIADTSKPKTRKWKYLAVACAIPFLFYVGWIPMNTAVLDTGNIQMSDFNPMNKKAVKIYSTRKVKISIEKNEPIRSWKSLTENINPDVKVYNYKFDDELYIPVRLDHTEITTVSDNEKVDTKVEAISNNIIESVNSKNNIHLIAGCFSSEANANVLVKDLQSKGYPAFIVDKNKGLYRVSVESFSSKNNANSTKAKLASEEISTWILNK